MKQPWLRLSSRAFCPHFSYDRSRSADFAAWDAEFGEGTHDGDLRIGNDHANAAIPDNLARWTAQTVGMSGDILDRMERAVAKVRERLLRATAALNQAGVPYAVVGGNAVASWVATVDEGAVRNTRDVDLLVRRSDLPAITTALEQAGFVRDELLDVVMFRDGAEGKPSEAVHLLFAGEKTRPDHLLPAPEIQTVEDPANFRVIALESLVVDEADVEPR